LKLAVDVSPRTAIDWTTGTVRKNWFVNVCLKKYAGYDEESCDQFVDSESNYRQPKMKIHRVLTK